ncbi:aminoglycoside phosphotransferase family protein [Shouchella lonarensis]|uniref:Phosphotransferase enzyme family protein n=1 Tax=Shouchella lonarensis TaxID=1464122 RepID=A0A1G6GTE8_9BACI|nr:aminoglycoside phosphotransferase family protein [Shouchella lonarensis]SDB85267.1 Phosphotransferase enzyme family protein [Shouchella lonarensis]
MKNYLGEQYGDITPIRLTGGYTNETFLLKGTTPLLVAKVYNLDHKSSRNEINCLKRTQRISAVPKMYDLIENSPSRIMVMAYCSGTSGQVILDSGDIETTKQIYKRLGEALARKVHAIKYNGDAFGIKECEVHCLNDHLLLQGATRISCSDLGKTVSNNIAPFRYFL